MDGVRKNRQKSHEGRIVRSSNTRSQNLKTIKVEERLISLKGATKGTARLPKGEGFAR